MCGHHESRFPAHPVSGGGVGVFNESQDDWRNIMNTRKTINGNHHRRGIVLLAAFLAGICARADQLPSLERDLQQLEQWRLEQHQRLQSEGGTTAQHRAVDDKYLERARALEFKRKINLDALGKKSGVLIGQGAHGTQPQYGRGAIGDIDTPGFQPKQYDAVLKHAKKVYGAQNIEVRGDSFTIKGKGLNTTVHRAPTKFKSPTGSTASQLEAGHGMDPESARTVGARKTPGTSSVKVHDNLAKGGYTLTKPTSQMTSADYQELGKMTMRNLDAAGINDPVLRKQAEMLKKGYRPESVGIKDPAAFQKKAAQVNMEAAQKTTATAQAYETDLTKRIDSMVKQGKTAEAAKLRQELAEHRELSNAAKKNLAAKQPEWASKTPSAKPGLAKKTAATKPELAQKTTAAKPGAGKKAAKTAGHYVKGAVILGRADKIREGIKEGDSEKTLGAVVGEDTAARVQVPEGEAYVQDLDTLGEAQERLIESELEAKLRRMGATKEEADRYIEARRGGDAETRMDIVEQVRERGGMDPEPARGLEVATVDESSWQLGDQLVDGAKQAGEYGGVVVDVASMGGLSRGREAQDDLDVVVDQAAHVRDQTEAIVNQQLYMGIRERGGTAEEAAAFIEARERGDVEARREILAGIQDRGDWREPEQTRALHPLDNIDDFQEDESWLQRYADGVVSTAEGLKGTLVDTPIKVISETGSELIEIATGLTEEGVARELIQERDPRVHREIERQGEERLEDGRQSLIDRLTELGASEIGAKRAADALIDDGDVTVLRELVDNVRKIQEMKAGGEADDEPLEDEAALEDEVAGGTGSTYDAITAEQKAEWDREVEEAARDLRSEEPSASAWTASDSGFERDSPGGLLDQFADRRQADRLQQVDSAASTMDLSQQMGEAATRGDRQIRDARQTRSAAGRDAQITRDQATREAAQAQRAQSWGTTLGDAVAAGVQQGLETMASTFGAAAADEAAGQIFGPTRQEREAKRAAAASAAREEQVASAGGQAPSAAGSGGPPGPPSDDSDPSHTAATETASAETTADHAPDSADDRASSARSRYCHGCQRWSPSNPCTYCGGDTIDPSGSSDHGDAQDDRYETVTIRCGECGSSTMIIAYRNFDPRDHHVCSNCRTDTSISITTSDLGRASEPGPRASTATQEGPTQAQIDAAYRDGRDWRRTVEATPMSQADVQAGTRERYARYSDPKLQQAFRRGYGQ